MTYEIGSRCDVCGSSKQKTGRGIFLACNLCERAAESIPSWAFDWVQAVAQKAAADALDDMRTELRRGHEP